MIVVTGGAGFIGSNLAARLVANGARVMVVDNLTDGRKCLNLAGLEISDYMDKDDFLKAVENGRLDGAIEGLFHQGACSSTTEWNGQYVMRNNFDYSKSVLRFCLKQSIPLVYASSAAVYGGAGNFGERADNESPLNPYGFSKIMFDRYLRSLLPLPEARVTGLRYFNVYGPHESHKDGMASVVFHFNNQLKDTGRIRLFEGSGGFSDGEQRRDFVHVDDICKVNIWALEHQSNAAILNVGTGTSRTFNEVAREVIKFHGRGEIEYIPFPDHLKDAYQHDTRADLTALRRHGYSDEFIAIEDGVKNYLGKLQTA